MIQEASPPPPPQQQDCDDDNTGCVAAARYAADLATLQQRLQQFGAHPPPDQPHHAALPRASVLVPLFERRQCPPDHDQHDTRNVVHVLLTQRPLSLRTHGGEVCFPGGKQDLADGNDDVVTALREAEEEVGLEPSRVRPLCRLATLESYTGLCVTPVVGWVEPGTAAEPAQLTVNPDEVEAAFAVPLAYFRDDANLSASKQMVEWRGGMFEMRTYHYKDVDSQKTFKIWGLTAYIAYLVSQIAFENVATVASPKVHQLKSLPPQSKEKDDAAITFSGYLFRRQHGDSSSTRKQFWSKRYFVLENNMLHQYDGERQAARRSASATKKDRLPLLELDVVVMGQDDSEVSVGEEYTMVLW